MSEQDLVVCELPTSYGLTVPGREFAYYGPGDATLPRALAEALGAKIKTSASLFGEASPPQSSAENDAHTLTVTPVLALPKDTTLNPLPADFPARNLPTDAMYLSLEQVQTAADAELLKLKGVGKATLRDIRGYAQVIAESDAI